MDLFALRLLFVLIFTVACWFLRPFGLQPWTAGGVGAVASGLIILFELRVRALSLRRLIGAVIGSLLGITGAFLFSLVLRNSLPDGRTRSLFQIAVLLLMTYVKKANDFDMNLIFYKGGGPIVQDGVAGVTDLFWYFVGIGAMLGALWARFRRL